MQALGNLLLNTDSYKASHWLQYPPGTDATFFYVESRGGLYDRTHEHLTGVDNIIVAMRRRLIEAAAAPESDDIPAGRASDYRYRPFLAAGVCP